MIKFVNPFKKRKKATEPLPTPPTEPQLTKGVKSSAPKAGEREPYLMVVAGQKGVGKTFTTLNEISNYVEIQKRPVVIFDTNGEVAYRPYRRIWKNGVKGLKTPEIRIVMPVVPVSTTNKGKVKVATMTRAEKTDTLSYLLENFYNGLLLVEDMNNYVTNTRADGIVSHVVNNRHKGQDIIIHVQSLAKLDPTLWENTAIVRLHKQADELDRYIDRVPQKELMSLAYHYVNEAYLEDPRVYVYVDMWKVKITNVQDVPLFEKACKMYLGMNNKKFIAISNSIGTKNRGEVEDYFVDFCKKNYLK